MKVSTDFKKKRAFNPIDSSVVEKIRWSLSQRLRKQLQQLNLDFFDEVDDFLFQASKQSQFDEENPYLKSMRELRNKQSLYEESFLRDVLLGFELSLAEHANSGISSASANLGVAFERVEIDLAFRSMQRKAEKFYLPHLNQIEALNRRLGKLSEEDVISGAVLIQSSLHAFMHSQSCFSIPLDIRLMFIKLFEQHFLLCMERLFLDMISILSNAGDTKFVDRLYSSSSAFSAKTGSDKSAKTQLENNRENLAMKGVRVSSLVETQVTELIAELCDSHRMPLFIERMLRTQWRSVMSVVGLNAGCDSPEWNEAKYCALMLSAAAVQGSAIASREKQLVLDQLEQGFQMVRIDRTIQESFLDELRVLFRLDQTLITKTSDSAGLVNTKQKDEVSISPCGKRVLDQDDLSELAKLLGDSDGSQQNQQVDSDLDAFFIEVDELPQARRARYKAEGRFWECQVIRTDTGFFEIQFDQGKAKVRLSRLGLAMSLKQQDLKLDSPNQIRSVSPATVLDRKLH